MALSVVQHSTNNLRVHHTFFNKSYRATTSMVKMHCSGTSAVGLCSGFKTRYGLLPGSVVRLHRQHRQYSNVSVSDAVALADDDFYTFEKFTKEAIKVVDGAKYEAIRSDYALFGAEHVLLAIISEGESIAAEILTETMGIDNVEDARKVVETFTKRGSRFDANRVFKLSIENARKLGHNYIDTEHILLGLIPEDKSKGTIVLDILKHLGVDPTNIRNQLLRRMDGQKMVMLVKYGTNLTKLAKTGIQAGPVTEQYTKEVAEQVINTLCTPTSKNPCLIGESRVVNNEIVRNLARRIACGEAPEEISGKRVIMLHMDRLVDASEELRKELFQEIKAQRDGIILFVDDIQSFIAAMGEAGVVDLIESGELQLISTASTEEEYEKNNILMTGFLPVEVPEPSIAESLLILRNFVSGKIRIEEEALLASVYLSHRYRNKRNLDDVFYLIENANSLVNKKFHRRDISEADIRSIVSLLGYVKVEEMAAVKNIVADFTLNYEVDDDILDEKCLYLTKRFSDRLTHCYNPKDFFEGKTKSLIDSKVLSEMVDKIKNEIVKREIKDADIVVDFDAADNRVIVHELVW